MSKLKQTACSVVGIMMMGATLAASYYYSAAEVNRTKYPVFGVDASNYQGIVNWETLDDQNVKFAFIKATEGSGYIDKSAARNLRDASETDILVSAYHFFSFDSAGETQAENFISVVDADAIDMPPVVDIEYYGDKKKNKPSVDETEEILRPLLERLEEHYGCRPLIYTTLPVYLRYIKDGFGDYPLWIRSVNSEPDLIEWKFWQYSDKGVLDGYYGEEKCIDFNVYNGSEEEFYAEYGRNIR